MTKAFSLTHRSKNLTIGYVHVSMIVEGMNFQTIETLIHKRITGICDFVREDEHLSGACLISQLPEFQSMELSHSRVTSYLSSFLVAIVLQIEKLYVIKLNVQGQ